MHVIRDYVFSVSNSLCLLVCLFLFFAAVYCMVRLTTVPKSNP